MDCSSEREDASVPSPWSSQAGGRGVTVDLSCPGLEGGPRADRWAGWWSDGRRSGSPALCWGGVRIEKDESLAPFSSPRDVSRSPPLPENGPASLTYVGASADGGECLNRGRPLFPLPIFPIPFFPSPPFFFLFLLFLRLPFISFSPTTTTTTTTGLGRVGLAGGVWLSPRGSAEGRVVEAEPGRRGGARPGRGASRAVWGARAPAGAAPTATVAASQALPLVLAKRKTASAAGGPPLALHPRSLSGRVGDRARKRSRDQGRALFHSGHGPAALSARKEWPQEPFSPRCRNQRALVGGVWGTKGGDTAILRPNGHRGVVLSSDRSGVFGLVST